MVDIERKEECCGCQACVESCPKKCISLEVDNEGFWYPLVNGDDCINCHLCEKVCPIINRQEERRPIDVYAAKNPNDEIREESSSGGVFTLLAENIIKQGGVVFGAKWNSNWEVEHGYCDTIGGLKDFRGSKYVQSNIVGCYARAEEFLKEGRKVLFSGTPCQIAGLKGFLGKEYENLLLVDCICHGVPSPGVFRQYLDELRELAGIYRGKTVYKDSFIDKHLKITNINFRDKRCGWNDYNCTVSFGLMTGNGNYSNRLKKEHYSLSGNFFSKWALFDKDYFSSDENIVQYSVPYFQDAFLRGFNTDLYTRPSCSACQFRGLRGGSDITLGDFWGISEAKPEFDDNKGVSAVLINTLKGKVVFNALDFQTSKTSFEVICHYNNSLIESDPPHKHRVDFFKHADWSVHQRVYKYCWPTRARRMLSLIKRIKSLWR